eukprot:6643341-Prorocentrum_lima.AAC.1
MVVARVASGHHLLADLHGDLLRLVAAETGMHFAGLQVAAAKLRGMLSPQLCKKLRQVDVAYNVSRHLTLPASNGLVALVAAELGAVG